VWGKSLLVLLMLGVPAELCAWSPDTASQIALEAASISPPDLRRQIERHERAFLRALREEAANPSFTGLPLEQTIAESILTSAGMIRTHQPFEEIVRQLGVTAYYVAYANNPLVIGRSDPDERSYFGDYLRYVDSARPRFAVVFNGLVPEFEASGEIDKLLSRTFQRGLTLYPYIGREYQRIGGPHGTEQFDDRSTAFGISAVAFSQAVSDLAIVLRHIWIEAGGHDPREGLPVRKGEFKTPRTSPIPLASFRKRF